MEDKNKQQEWIDKNPVIWWIFNKLLDFTIFYAKVQICLLIMYWLLIRR